MEHPLFQASGDETAVEYPLTVLLRGHNHRGREIIGCIPYRMKIGTREFMVVRKVEVLDDPVIAAQIVSERGIVDNS